MDNSPSNTPAKDPLLERAEKLAGEAEARQREADLAKQRIADAQKKQEQTGASLEKLQRASQEVEEAKDGMALNATKLMLMQPEEVKAFLNNAERQATRYEHFKANHEAAFAKLPQTEENKAKMESIVKNARDSYAAFYDAYSAIPNDGPWKLKTDEVHAEQWKKMFIGVKALGLNMDAFDTLTGDYSETVKLFIPEANRYSSNKKEDAEWKVAFDAELSQMWTMRTAFFKENPDPTKDTDEVKAIRAILVEAEALFDTNQPNFKTDEKARGATFLAIQKMKEGLSMYETYKELEKRFPTETAIASAAPQANEAGSTVDLTKEKGGILVLDHNNGFMSYFIPASHPAFNIAADRPDIAFKVLDNGGAMELTASDWEKVGGLKDGAWRKAGVQPVGEAVARRTDNPEPPAPIVQPAPQPSKPKESGAPVEGNKPAPEATQPPTPSPQDGNKSEGKPTETKKPSPKVEETPKPPVVIQKEPAPAAEKAPERIRAVLVQDGTIEVATQETIYIAYYLPNGERFKNYVRFPASDVKEWSIDGMCEAERTDKGWVIRPDADLRGSFLFNVGGSTSIIKLPETAKKEDSGRENAPNNVPFDPELPTLSRIFAESQGK